MIKIKDKITFSRAILYIFIVMLVCASLTSIFYYSYIVKQRIIYDAKVEILDGPTQIGFATGNRSVIDFGKISSFSTSTKYLNLTNNEDYDLYGYVELKGNISNMFIVEPYEFNLTPGQLIRLKFSLYSLNNTPGFYDGNVKITLKRKLN